MKDKDIEKWREEEIKRREKEKQQFSALINRYNETLSMGKRENQELMMRLKELIIYFGSNCHKRKNIIKILFKLVNCKKL